MATRGAFMKIPDINPSKYHTIAHVSWPERCRNWSNTVWMLLQHIHWTPHRNVSNVPLCCNSREGEGSRLDGLGAHYLTSLLRFWQGRPSTPLASALTLTHFGCSQWSRWLPNRSRYVGKVHRTRLTTLTCHTDTVQGYKAGLPLLSECWARTYTAHGRTGPAK